MAKRALHFFANMIRIETKGVGSDYQVSKFETDDYVTFNVFFRRVPKYVVLSYDGLLGKIEDLYMANSLVVVVRKIMKFPDRNFVLLRGVRGLLPVEEIADGVYVPSSDRRTFVNSDYMILRNGRLMALPGFRG